MSGNAFRGAAVDQDIRFSDKQQKLIKSMRFPPEFNTRVDMHRVNLDVIRPWIVDRIYQMLGIEDEVIPEFVFSLLEQDQYPDPKVMQVNLTGFLEKHTPKFMYELWCLLVSAQDGIGGIPKQLLDAKRKELEQKHAEKVELEAKIKERMERDKLVIAPSTGKKPSAVKETRSGSDDERIRSRRRSRSRSATRKPSLSPSTRRDRSRSREERYGRERRHSSRSRNRSYSRSRHLRYAGDDDEIRRGTRRSRSRSRSRSKDRRRSGRDYYRSRSREDSYRRRRESRYDSEEDRYRKGDRYDRESTSRRGRRSSRQYSRSRSRSSDTDRKQMKPGQSSRNRLVAAVDEEYEQMLRDKISSTYNMK